jgi:hypothetical protein
MQSPHFKKHVTTTADDPVLHFDRYHPDSTRLKDKVMPAGQQ